jgi:hypothetical protein
MLRAPQEIHVTRRERDHPAERKQERKPAVKEANLRQTREMIDTIKQYVSAEQWNMIVAVLQELFDGGVAALTTTDIFNIVESVVLEGDDSVTLQDLEEH